MHLLYKLFTISKSIEKNVLFTKLIQNYIKWYKQHTTNKPDLSYKPYITNILTLK